MAGLKKRFIDIEPCLNDDIKGVDVDFDKETAYYTVTARSRKFKHHPQVTEEMAFGSYIMHRLIRAFNLVYVGADEPVIDNGMISICFQLAG